LLAAFITPAYSSEQKKKPDYSGHFGDMDTDGDDQVNWKEFKKYFSHAFAYPFSKNLSEQQAVNKHKF